MWPIGWWIPFLLSTFLFVHLPVNLSLYKAIFCLNFFTSFLLLNLTWPPNLLNLYKLFYIYLLSILFLISLRNNCDALFCTNFCNWQFSARGPFSVFEQPTSDWRWSRTERKWQPYPIALLLFHSLYKRSRRSIDGDWDVSRIVVTRLNQNQKQWLNVWKMT